MGEVIDYRAGPGGCLSGELHVPGDKSISHRAVMLASIAEGVSRIDGLLKGEDVLATMRAFRQLGVRIEDSGGDVLEIHGAGLHGLRASTEPLDLGNSGTAIRLLAGLLVGQRFASVLVGDESLSRRPMRRIADPLRRMGARLETASAGTPPLRVEPAECLRGIRYRLPVASAQVKSAVLLAGLYADGDTCVEEPVATRDHTERMLAGFGYPCQRNGNTICVSGGGRLRATDVSIPADISSAAFFLVGSAIAPGSEMRLLDVGVNPTRTGILDVLRAMGADLTVDNERMVCGEPVADVHIRHSQLIGTDIAPEVVPRAIDEFPVLCVAAACARGVTTIRGAGELRHKESDRIATMVAGLRALGAAVEELEDGMRINGGSLNGGAIDSAGDHRVAMAFCVASLCATGEVTVRDCANVATSFPGFVATARSSGMLIDELG